MLRNLWISNSPWSSTGYGVQTKLVTQRLQRDGHPTGVLCYYGLEGGMFVWDGVRCYPKHTHPYGQDVITAHTQHFNGDIALSLTDVWVYEPEVFTNKVRWVAYYPVDHDPIPPKVAQNLKHTYASIAMSQFGQDQAAQHGIESVYIPHGVDTSLYRPQDPRESRRKLNLPEDAYVIGMVAMNKGYPSRKAFPENLRAFAEFHRRHPDSILYLHTNAGNVPDGRGGLNLPELCETLGIVNAVRYCDQYTNMLGFNDDYMVAAYNAMDVLLATSLGEGFGVPTLEAQACGTPVIVGDWCASAELCFAGARVAPTDAERFWTPLASWQYLPRAGAIVDALESVYCHNQQTLAIDARHYASSYDIDHVYHAYWRPFIYDLEARIRNEETIRLPLFKVA